VVVATVAIVIFGGVLFAGFSVLTKMQGERDKQISKLLNTDIRELLEKDGYAAYKQAADKCREILALKGDSLAGHAFLAYVDAILAGEHGEGEAVKADALQHVDAARRLGRHSHLIAAEAYLKFHGGDLAGALKDLKAVLEGDQGAQSTFLQGVLGILQLQSGDLDAARETLGRAQKANPGDARISWALAEQYRRRGEGYELQASGFFDWALRAQKDHAPSILGKSLLLLDRGQYDEVSRAVQLVLSSTSGASPRQQALARMIHGNVLYLGGKTQEGAAEEQEAARADPSNPEIPHLIGRRKLREGDVAGAIEAFQRAIGIDPRRISYYADLTRALLAREGGSKQAIEQLKRAVSRLGESPRLALLLGEAYRASGDLDMARGQYEKAIALGKPYPDARVALARLHRAQGNVPLALVELDQAIDEYRAGSGGGAARAYVEKAETERARGARREVLQDLYEKALQADPASCDALWGAASGELETGKRGDKARQRLEAYGRLCPRGVHAAEAARMLGGK
jgi:tetratricopeptide (TPR) repeat protein